jgi:hypothetical protein
MVYHWSYAILHRESTCTEIWKWSLHTDCTSSAGRHCITFMSPLETGASVPEVRVTLEFGFWA